MTDKHSRAFGKEYGVTQAESICLEPPFHLLPPILEKYRTEKAWRKRAEDQKEFVVGRHPDVKWSAFKSAFVARGLKFVRDYIKELKDDGLLKDM